MNKRHSLNFGAVLCLFLAGYWLYCLLLQDSAMPLSIHSFSASVSHCVRHWHIVVIGLLPIYVALMVFGTAVMGVYFGSAVQRWIGALFGCKKQ